MEARSTSPGRVGKDALVREIFEEMDEDSSGFLEFTEVGNILDQLGLRVDDNEVNGNTIPSLSVSIFVPFAILHKDLRKTVHT